jgi:CheY-like chemotaxis protein
VGPPEKPTFIHFQTYTSEYVSLKKNKNYFIVDDDSDDQQFLIEALTENDPSVQCYTYFNGREAIAHLQKNLSHLPDAIFLDLNMPRMNGKECLAELKHTAALQHIPVIIYSTTTNQREIQKALSMGASHFLIKQSNFNELCKELKSIAVFLNIPAPG